MAVLNELQPQVVWNYFEEICQIPRPSKKEEKIIAYLLAFGKKHNLETKQDEIGNVLIKKAGTGSNKNTKPVILQSHIDMVCEKNSDVEHDFDNDAIKPYISETWVKAKGTTLGADDGIGVAAQLAILADKDIEHPAIECLFTVDEETGLTGAFALQKGFLEGKTLINLDSEDEGELFIGCAGGTDTVAEIPIKTRNVPEKATTFKISVTGLQGGHSGDEIDKGLGNSNKILNRFLWEKFKEYEIYISDFNGGNLRNAIPREAFAKVSVSKKWKSRFEKSFVKFTEEIKSELAEKEPNLTLSIEEIAKEEIAIHKETQKNLLNALYSCPHGVIKMSENLKGLVETSTNLASVKFKEDHILITTSQRSSVETAKRDIANMVESVFLLANAKVYHSDGYPGWNPNPNSKILKRTVTAYKKLFKTEPIVRAIHAGLECGLFLEKYPTMDMISFGPTIKGAHSPDERIDIETTQKFWDLLIEVLRKLA